MSVSSDLFLTQTSASRLRVLQNYTQNMYCNLKNKLNYKYNSKFHIITAVFLKSKFFWYVTSFFLVNNFRRFERLCCAHPQDQRKVGLDFLITKKEFNHLKRQEIFSTQHSVSKIPKDLNLLRKITQLILCIRLLRPVAYLHNV